MATEEAAAAELMAAVADAAALAASNAEAEELRATAAAADAVITPVSEAQPAEAQPSISPRELQLSPRVHSFSKLPARERQRPNSPSATSATPSAFSRLVARTQQEQHASPRFIGTAWGTSDQPPAEEPASPTMQASASPTGEAEAAPDRMFTPRGQTAWVRPAVFPEREAPPADATHSTQAQAEQKKGSQSNRSPRVKEMASGMSMRERINHTARRASATAVGYGTAAVARVLNMGAVSSDRSEAKTVVEETDGEVGEAKEVGKK